MLISCVSSMMNSENITSKRNIATAADANENKTSTVVRFFGNVDRSIIYTTNFRDGNTANYKIQDCIDANDDILVSQLKKLGKVTVGAYCDPAPSGSVYSDFSFLPHPETTQDEINKMNELINSQKTKTSKIMFIDEPVQSVPLQLLTKSDSKLFTTNYFSYTSCENALDKANSFFDVNKELYNLLYLNCSQKSPDGKVQRNNLVITFEEK